MTSTENWAAANQRYLVAAVNELRRLLEAWEERASCASVADDAQRDRVGDADPEAMSHSDLQQLTRDMSAPPALDVLSEAFGLSAFERSVLLLCAGMELDAAFADLCVRVTAADSRGAGTVGPTFALALAALRDPHWSALSPSGPLRHWRLIELQAGHSLVNSPLRIDERVLHYLAGVQHLDEQLLGFVETVASSEPLVPSHEQLAERMAAAWRDAGTMGALPVLELCGQDVRQSEAIAVQACASLGLNVRRMSAHVLPTAPSEFELLVRLWQREALLGGSALLLDCHAGGSQDELREARIARLMDLVEGLIVLTPQRRSGRRAVVTFDVRNPSKAEQRELWAAALSGLEFHQNGQLDRLVSHFDFRGSQIVAACRQYRMEESAAEPADREPAVAWTARLWTSCREQARPHLDDLAQRVQSSAGWDDLVLPSGQRATLCDIVRHVRHRARVYEEWGFAAQSSRGLGISALFSGASGTGKTLAAEVLANDLQLDLYRIDLSQVVSKYIGETEKNLRRVFDAADEGGAVLLFDEADALFGKRSEVKDSHDRYANIEVSYLLQRMESYRGLAILTTNLKSALDSAFLRRLRFVVPFPFPDLDQRARIWRRVFPSHAPRADLDPGRLAQLNIPGGNIRNIALNAAFLAADDERPIDMQHVLRAAQAEYMKLEKSLTDVEIKGWL